MNRDERLAERETTIRWNGHKDLVWLFTASKPVDRKIQRAGHTPTRVDSRNGVWRGSFYVIPYKAIRWGVKLAGPRKTPSTPPGFRGKKGV